MHKKRERKSGVVCKQSVFAPFVEKNIISREKTYEFHERLYELIKPYLYRLIYLYHHWLKNII